MQSNAARLPFQFHQSTTSHYPQGYQSNAYFSTTAGIGPEIPMQALDLQVQALRECLSQVANANQTQNSHLHSNLSTRASTALADRTNAISGGDPQTMKPKENLRRKESKPGYNRDLKIAALNYFCNNKGCDMKSVCHDMNMLHIY